MKKIVIAANSTWYLHNFRMRMVRELVEKGYDIHIVAECDKFAKEFTKLNIKTHNVFLNPKGKNPLIDMITFFHLMIHYIRISPDIVLQYNIKFDIYGSLAAKCIGLPTINNISGLGSLFIKEDFATMIGRFLYRVALRRSDKIFFQNNDDYQYFKDFKMISNENVDVLPGSGVDITRFKPVSKKKESEVFEFLFVSRILWEKGIQYLIDAGELLHIKGLKFRINILGFLDVKNASAVHEHEMNEWVKKFSFVNYLGTSNKVEEIIAEMDCIVLPSYYREGIPRNLLEAAAMGKPLITTDNIGCRETVDHGKNGYLCKMKDSEDLAKYMEMMIKLSKNEYEMFSQYGREKMVKEFDETIVMTKYFDSIDQIIG